MNNPFETKAYLHRENNRWVVVIELPGWLSLDLIQELEGYALVDLNEGIDLNENNLVTFAQMPLGETQFTCDNCGKLVVLPTMSKEKQSILERLKNYLRP